VHVEADSTASSGEHRVSLDALADRLRRATTREPELFLDALRDFCRGARALGVPAGTFRRVVEYHLARVAPIDAATRVRARELAEAYPRSAD
jgi:hypothetical protein